MTDARLPFPHRAELIEEGDTIVIDGVELTVEDINENGRMNGIWVHCGGLSRFYNYDTVMLIPHAPYPEITHLKNMIEDGQSIIEAFEKIDVDKMAHEGNGDVATKITEVLKLVGEVVNAAGVEDED